MAVISSHAAGTFCWVELSTTDAEAAKRFYGELLGWQALDLQMGPDRTYSMMQVDGHDAAAIYLQGPDEKASAVAPQWRSYVAAPDVDEATRRILDAGGDVQAGPFEAFDAGRLSIATDPTGAVVAVWQARQHIGASWAHDPGAVVWTELLTHDTARASQFYARVFGWAAEAQAGPTPYTVFKTGGRLAGGMMPIADQTTGPTAARWNVYFAVADCDAAAARAQALGGQVLVPPQDVPNVGRIAQVADPQGAPFAVVKTAAQTGG
jgi:uncharacterized protein